MSLKGRQITFPALAVKLMGPEELQVIRLAGWMLRPKSTVENPLDY